MNRAFLTIENLSKTFGKGESVVRAVDNVSFSADEGEIILIMGPSGSGKTTLLMMIGALLTPDSGSIYYGDENIVKLSKNKLAGIRLKNIGFVFQSFNLLQSLNTLENVAVVLELHGVGSKEASERAHSLLASLGLQDRVLYNIYNLSGGEKQRVSIARALSANPPVILADEPTANLDSVSGHKVMELLTHIAKKERKVVVIVSHDMRLMDIADRVLWLQDGRLKEGHEQLIIDPVCKMTLQQHLAPYSLKHNGETYYFCSKKCFESFKDTITARES